MSSMQMSLSNTGPSTAMSTKPQRGGLLSSLPRELRDQIYENVFAVHNERDRRLRLSPRHIHVAPPTRLALLSTCRFIREEVLSGFYRLIDACICSRDLDGLLRAHSEASLLAITHLTVDIIVWASSPRDWKLTGSETANAELSQLASLPALEVLCINMCEGLFETWTERQYLLESITQCPSLRTVLLRMDGMIVSRYDKGRNISYAGLQGLLQDELDDRAKHRRVQQAVADE